jgi:hypothetical protein
MGGRRSPSARWLGLSRRYMSEDLEQTRSGSTCFGRPSLHMAVRRPLGGSPPAATRRIAPRNKVAQGHMGAHVTGRVRVRVRTAAATRSAASSVSSCSHTRRGSHPARTSLSSVSLSRRLLPSIFSRHQSAFALGQVACSSQPCQKQPLTKTATLAPEKTTSACLLRDGTGRRCIRKRRPCRCSADLNARSGVVSRRRWRCIRPLTSGEEATTPSVPESSCGIGGEYGTARCAAEDQVRSRTSAARISEQTWQEPLGR